MRSPVKVWKVVTLAAGGFAFAMACSSVVSIWFFIKGQLRLADVVADPSRLLGVPGALPASMAAFELSLAVAAWLGPLVLRDAPLGLVSRLRCDWRRATGREVALLTAAFLALGTITSSLMGLTGVGGSIEVLDHAVARLSVADFIGALVFGGLGAGFSEELFFRGLIQTPLEAWWGRWPAVVTSAVLFGLAHGDPVHSPYAFVVGLVFGWAAARSGTIVNGVVAHALNNVLALSVSRLQLGELSTAGNLTGLVVGALVATACVLTLQRNRHE